LPRGRVGTVSSYHLSKMVLNHLESGSQGPF